MSSAAAAPAEQLRRSPAARPAASPARWYISEAGAANLPKYQYKGSDNSLLYRYFCSPLAEVLVWRFVPEWVAPNTITCLGLVPSLVGHAVIWYYCSDLRARCPAWCWALNAVCTFVYQTVDNMDGKQARRTGTSSPVGLLLDHNADALNIVLLSLNVMAMFQVGGSAWLCLAIWLSSASSFFFANWEEYYTGELRMGIINGPTEGLLTWSATQAASALFEDYPRYWNGDFVAGVSRKACFVVFAAVLVVGVMASHIGGVVQALRRAHGAGSTPRFFTWHGAVTTASPFVMSCAVAVAWLVLDPSAAAFARWPRLLLWLLGLHFLHSVTRVQLAHICSEACSPWRAPVPHLLAACGYCCVTLLEDDAHGAAALAVLWVCAALLFASWLHMVCVSSCEMADILGISLFSVPAQAEGSGGAARKRR